MAAQSMGSGSMDLAAGNSAGGISMLAEQNGLGPGAIYRAGILFNHARSGIGLCRFLPHAIFVCGGPLSVPGQHRDYWIVLGCLRMVGGPEEVRDRRQGRNTRMDKANFGPADPVDFYCIDMETRIDLSQSGNTLD